MQLSPDWQFESTVHASPSPARHTPELQAPPEQRVPLVLFTPVQLPQSALQVLYWH